MLGAARTFEPGLDATGDSTGDMGGLGQPIVGRLAGRRSANRTTRVLRIARISDGCGESLGIIRNVSDHGMMVEVHERFALGRCVTVDLGDGVPLLGELCWREGASVGLHFPQPVDHARILGKPEVRGRGQVNRLPRVRTAHSAQLQREGRRIKVEVCDISVGGACLRSDEWLEPDEQVSLLIPGLAPISGAVRWQSQGSAGIAFHRAASIHALMAWLGAAGQDSAVLAGGEAADEGMVRDPLTGLPDRRGFLAQLDAIIADRADHANPLCLALVDLDGFKALNDIHGHETGDAVLAEAGRRLSGMVGENGLVGRLGSDEFAVLLNTAAAHVEDMLGAIQSALSEPILTPSGWRELSAGIGVARYPQDAAEGAELLRHADIALGAAQQFGGRRLEHFTREMLDSLSRRAKLHDTFAAGLRAGEFTVHYEPIVPLAGDCGVKMEALFRWEHPQHGLLKAAQFSEVFTEEALSAQIGMLVLHEVIAQIAAWRAAEVPISSVTVNATLADFRNPAYVDTILATIAAGQITSSDICIEITEDVLIDDAMHCARHEIERLHQAGVCLVFDDFGTGYASLRHLRDMPICAVKIDRSFIARIAADEVDRGLVESIVGIAHLLGRVVVAEGVETPEQAELLRAMSCDMMQGYLVAGALPADAAAGLASEIAGREEAK